MTLILNHRPIKFPFPNNHHRLVREPPPSLIPTVLTVPLRLIKLPIKPLCPPLHSKAQQNRTKTSKKNKPTPKPIKRLLARREEIRREPVRALTNTIRNRNQRRFLAARRRHQRRLPGQLQVEAVVGAGDEKAGAEVARADVGRGDHDGDSDGGGDDREHDVVAGFAEAAGGPGEGAGAGVGEGVGGCLDEVGV